VFKHRGVFGPAKYDIKSSSFEGKTIKPWTRLAIFFKCCSYRHCILFILLIMNTNRILIIYGSENYIYNI
jgi:hypothetical protein